MSTEIINYDSPLTLDSIPAQSLADFQSEALNSAPNRLASRLQKDGKVDTAFHIGKQIKSEQIAGKVLTIIRIGRGMAPKTDNKGNPVWVTDENGMPVTDENGVAVQDMSVFPICHFAEAPGWWYNAGAMMNGIIESLCDECGDDPDGMVFPNVNAALADVGGLRAYFDWKDSTKNPGQKYMNIIIA